MERGTRMKLALCLACAALLAAGCSRENGASSTRQQSPPATAKRTSSGNIGIGPVEKVELGELDHEKANTGGAIFDSKCAVCHKIEERYVGPALAGVTDRRTPEWIMNMILNPDQMIKEDPDAKALFLEYLTPMTYQNVSEEDARAILEYFRSQESSQ